MVLFSDSVVAGAVSGGVTRLLIEPLDVLKVRFQLQLEAIGRGSPISKYQGVLHATTSILKEEGVRAFWKGVIPGELLYISFGATQFATFEACKKAAHRLSLTQNESWKFAVNTTCGCLAGFAATSVSQPFDTLRTRLIGQGEPKTYPSLYRALVMMYSENGIRTFYKGLTPALLLVVPQAGLHFGFYHSFTGFWDAVFPQKSAGDSVRSLVCGALSGILSKTIMLPLDLVKKRLEVQGFEVARLRFGRVQKYQGTIDCFISVLRQEGPLAFYKGISIALIKSATSVALSFSVYEKAMRHLQGA